MLPRPSVPMENPTSPAAVAAAEPAEEPPDPRSGFQGFLVWPPNQTSPPKAPFDSLANEIAEARNPLLCAILLTPESDDLIPELGIRSQHTMIAVTMDAWRSNEQSKPLEEL